MGMALLLGALPLGQGMSQPEPEGNALCRSKCSCRNNIVRCYELVHMPASFPPNTSEIYFDTFVVGSLPAGAFKSIPTVRKIEFTRCNIGRVEGCAFDGLPNLKNLIMIRTVIGSFGTMAIHDIATPTSIVMEMSTITTMETAAFFHLSNLTYFMISNCTIHEMEPHVFNTIENIQNGFKIRKTRFVAFHGMFFHKMQSVGNIEFSLNQIKEFPCLGLDNLVSATNELSIVGNTINCSCVSLGTSDHWSEAVYVKAQLLKSQCFGRTDTQGMLVSEALAKGSCKHHACAAYEPRDITKFRCSVAKSRTKHLAHDHNHDPHNGSTSYLTSQTLFVCVVAYIFLLFRCPL